MFLRARDSVFMFIAPWKTPLVFGLIICIMFLISLCYEHVQCHHGSGRLWKKQNRASRLIFEYETRLVIGPIISS